MITYHHTTKMETSLSHQGYGIPKKHLTDVDLDRIRRELTVSPFVPRDYQMANAESREFPLYLESSKKIYVPKHYGITAYGSPKELKLSMGKDIDVAFNGALRDEQREPVAAFLEAAVDPARMGGILNLPCAFGKTAIAIYTITQLHKKTLVIVHKEFLVDQWHERISAFAPTAKVGIIQGKRVEIEGKDIVIGLLQSLSMKEYPKETFEEFGFVIVDEIHRTGAEVFSRALAKVNFRYALGLSATLQRKDGLSKVFMWYIGGIVYRVGKRSDCVHVRSLTYDSDDMNYCRTETLCNGKLNMSKMINNICDHAPRTRFIAETTRDILKEDPMRKVLILSDRRGHLESIAGNLQAAGISDWGFYYGGMKQDDLKRSEGRAVILGTFQMSQEGLDIKGLDTLVLASPKSDIVQATGRILRDKACDRKNIPLIVDVVDDFSVFASQARKRSAYFKKCKYVFEGAKEDSSSEADGKQKSIDKYAFRKI